LKKLTTKTAKKNHLTKLINNKKIEAVPYNMKEVYEAGTLLEHKKFGIGFIEGLVGENKMNVFFEDSERTLLQNFKAS
jgi:hypothetical protein